MPSKGAIVLGGHVNGLGIVRALSALGVPTAVVTTKPYDIAHRSRCAVAHESLLEIEEQPELLVERLERRACDWAGWALVPTNDGALAALARYGERLSSTYRVIAPAPDAIGVLLDKRRMLEVARAVGVALPHCYGPAVPGTAALPELRFPVIVKPVVGYRFFTRFGCKLLRADDRQELERCIARVNEAGLACLVLDLIPGGDDQIYADSVYLDRRGQARGGITIRKLRQSPPFFGVARVAEVVDEIPELRAATIEIARRIGLTGTIVSEWKRDPRDGRMRFFEVNGRSVIYNALLRRAGIDMAALAWSEEMLGESSPVLPNGWRGVWIHLHADLLYSTLCRHDPVGMREFLEPYRRSKVFAVWSPSDPWPALAQWSGSARAAAAALLGATPRRELAEPARLPAETTAG